MAAQWKVKACGGKAAGRTGADANLWRDLRSGTNFLDLGFMLRRVEHMSRFYLYVPATPTAAHFQDLGAILRSGVTPNAVFTDVVTLGQERDASHSVSRGSPNSA